MIQIHLKYWLILIHTDRKHRLPSICLSLCKESKLRVVFVWFASLWSSANRQGTIKMYLIFTNILSQLDPYGFKSVIYHGTVFKDK